MNSRGRVFLTAEWRHLAMLNYEIDPAVVEPLVPFGTELDFWQGRTFVSVVGFQFLDTRLLGIPIPGHRDFDEVNLRFYVRRRAADGWRRGVAFVKEIAPRPAVVWIARLVYGENYVTLPMRHAIGQCDGSSPRRVAYGWRFRGQQHQLDLTTRGAGEFVEPGSEEEFITEHYWGYSARGPRSTTEYLVQHPRWRVSQADHARLDCDVAALYGEEFAPYLREPSSAFLADGSDVTVYRGTRVRE